jgi:DNA invertase Pin-like site-specific DNA recombinase
MGQGGNYVTNNYSHAVIWRVCWKLSRIRYTLGMATQPTQAVSYLRVSSLGQVQGDGFPRQREAIQSYAERNGIQIVGEFRDEGVSGTVDHGERDGFKALLERIAGNCVRLVVIERPDRLARDLLVQETLLASLIRLGVRVVDASGTDLTDQSDPSRVLIRQVLGAVAQHDRACLVAKLRAARQRQRVATGRCEGRKPYGAKVGEDRGLQRIKQLKGEGCSLREIAATLNAEGIPTRGGKTWSFGTVARLVR